VQESLEALRILQAILPPSHEHVVMVGKQAQHFKRHVSASAAAGAAQRDSYCNASDGGVDDDGWSTEGDDVRDASCLPPCCSLARSAYNVLRSIHPDMKIRKPALALTVSMMKRTMIAFVSATDPVLRSVERLSGAADAEQITAGLGHIMPGELVKHAKAEAVKALDRANSSNRKPSEWLRTDAMLEVDPRATAAHCVRHAVPVSRCVALIVSAVAEYIAAEVLELSGACAIQMRRGSIKVWDIKRAVRADDELYAMFLSFQQGTVCVPQQQVCDFETVMSASAAAGAAQRDSYCNASDGGVDDEGWSTEEDDEVLDN
jgi:histone H3/H4